MKSVLVTGATGFVGRQALQPLVDLGYTVHAVHHRSPPVPVEGVVWHRADLLKEDVRLETSHLLHLAWYAEPGAYWGSPLNRVWLERSIRLLERFSGARAVVAGTCAEYDWSTGVCVEGRTPLAPRGVYGLCKDQLRQHLERYSFSSAWARIFFLFGPHEPPAKIIPTVIRSVLAGREVRVSAARRDFLYVVDAGAALAALLDAEVGSPVNIGSGAAVPVRTVARHVAGILGHEELVVEDATQSADERVVADIARLTEEVCFRPQTSFPDALSHTVNWWQRRLAGDVA